MPSWAAEDDHEFSIQNLPYGVFSAPGRGARCGVAIGDWVVDLAELGSAGLLSAVAGLDTAVFTKDSLNGFMGYPRPVWQATRARLVELLTAEGGDAALQASEDLRAKVMVPMATVTMHMPARVGDYTDFYSSREHATNVGIMFRGRENALQPNWLHLPVGYHGRASSVYVSGTDVVRPRGQLQKDRDDPKQGSVYGACRLLDFELEMGFFVGGPGSAPGQCLSMAEAEDRIFGVVLMNDWSARDIQKWEYVPLGPFGAKNFATSISPWVVTLDALEPFRCPTSAGVQADPEPLEYLQDPNYGSYDVALEVAIQGEGMDAPGTVTRSNFANMYWNMKQQLVHHSVTGCNMQPGDLLGSGTISGQTEDSFGSMLELCWKGSKEVSLGASGEVRKFLKDGDKITMTGICGTRPGVPRVGFGAVTGRVLPAGSTVAPPALPRAASEAPRYQNFVLYGYWRSSSSWRVRVALNAKGIPYETRPVNLLQAAHKDAEHAERNALLQVPVLEFTDAAGTPFRLTQSLAIIQFLETAFPAGATGSLYPSDPLQRAMASEYAEMVNSGIQPLQNLSTFRKIDADTGVEGSGRRFAADAIRAGLAALEQLVVSRGGASTGYLVGPAPTVAEACLIPQLFNARRFEIDLEATCPTLLQVEAKCKSHPWFAPAIPDLQVDAVSTA